MEEEIMETISESTDTEAPVVIDADEPEESEEEIEGLI